MDIIKRLCEGQKPETRRRILAAYYLGAADGPRHPFCFRGKMFRWWSTWSLDAKIKSRNRRREKIPLRRHLPALREAAQENRQGLLPAMPRGLHARMAKNAPADRRAEIQRQLPILRQHLSTARQADSETMSGVRRQTVSNAPRGLQQAADGNVAVPAASHGATQVEPYVPVMLRNQAD